MARVAPGLILVIVFWLTAPIRAAIPSVRVQDLDGHSVEPFLAAESAPAIVFLFTSVDCPVSNRYAPVVQRLYEKFAPQGVAFWLVYPNPSDTAAAIRDHLKAFGYPVHALRDPTFALAKLANATITPEAAVYARNRSLLYHGRIDDRYVNIGLQRPAPTRNDLADAIAAALAGTAVREPATQAVGCYIADFVP